MLMTLSLRLRIFLFFVFLALAGIVVTCGALYIGYRRSLGGEMDTASALVFAAILSGFGLTALAAGVWLLFDENVAKPIERIAASMRTRAHAGVALELDTHEARYLGDLARPPRPSRASLARQPSTPPKPSLPKPHASRRKRSASPRC